MGNIPHLRSAVVSTARRRFSDHDEADIMAILDQYDTNHSTESGRARVQLVILKLCQGDIDNLRELVHMANVDYRDVLYWAEYLHKDDDQ